MNDLQSTMLKSRVKYYDRNPDYIAAGKSFAHGGSAQECLNIPLKPQTPTTVHKFRCSTQPAVGRRRIFYGRYNDPAIAEVLSHGISTKPSYVAGQLITPDPKTFFSYRLNERREEKVYASRKRAPLGKSHDQRSGLPKGISPTHVRYGLPTLKDGSASELVNPAKSRKQVETENSIGVELYKKSHSAYDVGETYNRKYDWARVPSNSCFGVETPHDNRGLNTKRTLKWLHQTLSEKAAQITSKRVDDFRERNIPQVGKVHDPIKDTLNVDNNHIYGIMVHPDEYGAGDLIHMRNSSNFLRGKDRERGIVAAVRQHLKKANYQNFLDLKSAFAHYDKDKSGTIDITELRTVCKQFNLPVQTELLEALMASCDKDKDAQINYVEFANFLNWKDKMPTGLSSDIVHGQNGDEYENKIISEALESGVDFPETGLPQLRRLGQQIDLAPTNYKTSYSLIGSTTSDGAARNSRQYGVPTIRSDRPAPKIRRIGDNTNYGDESDAYGLINPSIYSNYGVYEEDFFKSRDQNTMRRILDSIGVEMDDEAFQEIWEKAKEQSHDNGVSVELFRNILDEQMADAYVKKLSEKDPNDISNMIEELKKPDFVKRFEKSCNVKDQQIVLAN